MVTSSKLLQIKLTETQLNYWVLSEILHLRSELIVIDPFLPNMVKYRVSQKMLLCLQILHNLGILLKDTLYSSAVYVISN